MKKIYVLEVLASRLLNSYKYTLLYKMTSIKLSFYIIAFFVFTTSFASTTHKVEADSLYYPTQEYLDVAPDIYDKIKSMKFQSAIEEINGQITRAKRRNESVVGLEKALKLSNKGKAGLRGTDNVLVIDSVVVSKDKFLSAYPISSDFGTLTLSADSKVVSYQTQLNGIAITPQICDSTQILKFVRSYHENGTQSEMAEVEGLGMDGDVNYPFLMSDGQTFYFASRDNNGFGNYDLYVTRYDSDSKQFFKAENLGYPYNSYANDYMMVIDEENNLGWFASDRYQPADKVCIYTFIPNKARKTYDFENTPIADIRQAASLSSIKDLLERANDSDKQTIVNARLKATKCRVASKQQKTIDFEFALNSCTTYTSLSDFKNDEAQKIMQEWLQKTKNRQVLIEQLNTLRESYTSNNGKESEILNLERRIRELNKEISTIENNIRKAEAL